MSDQKKNPSGSVFTHEPLPYVVRLRATLDDDAVPQVQEHHVVAYTLFEALLQAVLEAGGSGADDSRFRVESIGPDLEAYRQCLLERLVALGTP